MPYAQRSDVELLFGAENVKTWADLDNTHNEAFITARIEWALESAANELNNELLNQGYEFPFNPVPAVLKEQTARLAGVKLYEGRGVQDYDETTGRPMHRLEWHRRQVQDWIMRVRHGVLNIFTGRNVSSAPGVQDTVPPLPVRQPFIY